MRVYLKIYSGNAIIPYNHQHLLVGTIHKWLGWNNLHGNVALFSFSRLEKGESLKSGLKFGQYCSMFISAYDDEIIKKLISGIQENPVLFDGLAVREISIQENPDLSQQNNFQVASPILIKRREGDKNRHFLFYEDEANDWLKETMLTKMKIVGIDDPTFDICFNKNYSNSKVSLIDYKGIKNKVNWCPIIMNGKPETKAFIWNVGVGNSTGIGFGAIR